MVCTYSEGDAIKFSIEWKVSVWILNDTVRLQLCRFVCDEDLLISVIRLIWLMQDNTTLRHLPLLYMRRKIQHFIENNQWLHFMC
jgi:hypothetical protein